MIKIVVLYQKLFAFWMRFPEKIRYLLVGGYNTVFSYLLYCLFLMFVFPAKVQLCLFLSFLVSSLNSFWTQKIFVFNSKSRQIVHEYAKCLFSWGISYVINACLLHVFLLLAFNAYVAQLIALILVTINSYLMLKYVAFRPLGGKK